MNTARRPSKLAVLRLGAALAVAAGCAAYFIACGRPTALSDTGPQGRLAIKTTSPLPSGTVGNGYCIEGGCAGLPPGIYGLQFIAMGGNPPPGGYTWSHPTGLASDTLPEGLTLSSSGLLWGVSTEVGTCTFTVQVSDGIDAQHATFTVTINPLVPLAITTPSTLPDGTVGTAYSLRFQASGGVEVTGYMWSHVDNPAQGDTLPSGLVMSLPAGIVAGTPKYAGSSTFTVSVTDEEYTPATVTGTFTITVAAPPSLTIVANAGNNQSVTAGTAVGVAPSAIVHDASNNPVAGVAVTFAVASGGGSITGASQTTAANGMATVGSWTLGTAAGTNTLTATAAGAGIAGNPVIFTAVGMPGPAAQISVSAGNNQSATTGTAVAIPPAVLVTDKYANPVSGVAVTYAVASGGGSLTGAAQTTGTNGIATVGSWTLGTTAGANTLTATAAGSGITGNPVTFTASATGAVPTQIAVLAGNNQSATVGLSVPVPPSVIVRDASNNPVAGVAVSFAVASGGGVVTGASQTTNTSGIATVGGWGLGTTAGTNTLTATATGSGITGNPVTFTATGTAGAAYLVGVSAGNNQSASPGSALPVPPAVFAHDFWGNPVPGLVVTFAVASGGGSITGAAQTTNASGIAAVGQWILGTTAGANTLTATAAGSGISGNPVTFSAIGVSAAGVTLTFVGGGATCISTPYDWSCAANWSPAQVPTSADSVVIPSSATYSPSLTANAVAGAVNIAGFNLTLSGHTLTVTRGFATTGSGFLRMINATDSLIVGGDATFGGGSESGALQTGVLVVHGSLLQPNSSQFAFVACCSFTAALVGPGTHNLQFVDIYSHFLNLDISQASGTVNMLSPLVVVGQLVDTGSVAATILGGGRALTAYGVDVTGNLTLDDAPLSVQNGMITAFDNVSFQNYGGGEIQLTILGSGSYTFTGLAFSTSPPSSGFYVSATASPAALSLTIHSNLTPSFAQTYTQAGTGATVAWLSP
jgi:Putative Ig domain